MSIEGFFYNKVDNFTLNVSFKFKSDNIIGLIGESGSGKSTFLRCLSGLLKPSYGYFSIDGQVLFNSEKKIFVEPNMRRIGHVLQTPVFFDHLSFFDNLKISVNSVSFKYYDFNQLISLFGLSKIKKRKSLLSGGEKQRVSILQAFFINPKFLLFDESLSFQDIRMKQTLMSLFKNLNFFYNIPIIYVSHDISTIESFTDNLFYMNHGKLLSC